MFAGLNAIKVITLLEMDYSCYLFDAICYNIGYMIVTVKCNLLFLESGVRKTFVMVVQLMATNKYKMYFTSSFFSTYQIHKER